VSQAKPVPPKNAEMLVLEVVRSERVTPNMMRITLGGDALARFTPMGFDQWFRLFLPLESLPENRQTSFALPKRIDLLGYVQFLAMPKATRPIMRNYTVRAFRPLENELDIDFVAHGDNGPASRWATGTGVGDTVALLDQGVLYNPQPADWQLFVADESGLPAVAGVLRDAPRDTVGHAFIEVADAADAQPTDAPPGVEVHWLVRGHGEKPGTLALATVQAFPLPAGTPYAFVVGEQSLPTSLRRWLVNERGVPKSHVTFCGFWRATAG
jgi:NADPH-dependent ferric siderophore reductase